MIKEKLLSEKYELNSNYKQIADKGSQYKLFLEEIHFKNKYCVIDKCPYCGFNDFIKISEIDSRSLPADIVICGSCKGSFKYKIFNDEANNFYYDKISYAMRGKKNTISEINKLFEQRVRFIAYPRYYFINRMLKLKPEDGPIVELGCNDGANLMPWKNNGFDVFGVDMDSNIIDFGISKGLNLQKGDMLNYKLPDRTSLMILSHVLEHVCDINRVLDKIKANISNEAYIFVESPGIKKDALGDPLTYFDLEHNYNFDFHSMAALLIKYGFYILYGDEYIRMICSADRTFKISKKFRKERFIQNLIKKLDYSHNDVYRMLACAESKCLRVRLLNKLQNWYFRKYFYK